MLTTTRLVENSVRHYGRFSKTPIANPLDEFTGLKRVFKNFRTKEWAGFTVVHPELHSAMILQNAKFIKSSEIHIYDRATRELNAYKAVSSQLDLTNDLLHASPQFRAKNYFMGCEFSDNTVKINFDMAATEKSKAFKGEIILDAKNKSHPLVVSAKLPPAGTMYTNKIIFPASGWWQVGDKRYNFISSRDLFILDEHKSHLPYFTEWLWGTFGLHADGKIVGANFCARPQYDDQEDESCLWTPDRAEPLDKIKFEKLSDDELSAWRVYSADKRLDVTFTPEGKRPVKHNFIVVAVDYLQLFGSYSGAIRGENKTWTFENIHGIFEIMKIRS